MDEWNNTTSGDGFCCVLLGHEINPPALTLRLDNTCVPLTGIAASSCVFPFAPCVRSSLFLKCNECPVGLIFFCFNVTLTNLLLGFMYPNMLQKIRRYLKM
jgi:hypothetical protein